MTKYLDSTRTPLSAEDVATIRAQGTDSASRKRLAEEYSVPRKTVERIVNGK